MDRNLLFSYLSSWSVWSRPQRKRRTPYMTSHKRNAYATRGSNRVKQNTLLSKPERREHQLAEYWTMLNRRGESVAFLLITRAIDNVRRALLTLFHSDRSNFRLTGSKMTSPWRLRSGRCQRYPIHVVCRTVSLLSSACLLHEKKNAPFPRNYANIFRSLIDKENIHACTSMYMHDHMLFSV